jgi:hypothetical protein
MKPSLQVSLQCEFTVRNTTDRFRSKEFNHTDEKNGLQQYNNYREF